VSFVYYRQESLAQPSAVTKAVEPESWGDEVVTDWANEPVGGAPAPAPAAAAAKFAVSDDWSSAGQVQQSDWAAETAGPADQTQPQWGGSSNWA
jgi:hypothetical protein